MKTFRVLLSFLVCGLFASTESYRILGIFPFCSRSHQMMFDALVKGLAKRGHLIDIVTCFPPKKSTENVTILMNVEDSQAPLVNSWTFDAALNVGSDPLPFIAGLFGNELCKLMGREELQRIIKNPPNDPPYDLVIVEAFGANCFLGLAEWFKVPAIFISTTVEMPWINRAIGNPSNLAFMSSFFGGLSHPFTFWERVKNVLHDASTIYRHDTITGDAQTELMRKYLGPEIPHIRELEKRVTLALVNSFHTLSGVRPRTPGLIEVGGLHVEDNYAEITKELKHWLDESKDGVVYFTLGSMVNIETMPNETVKALYNAFEKISPIRVLMKVANEDKLLPGKPENLVTSSWIPQVPVLAHENTRVFITHGGLMSTQEALYHRVPLIGIPLFGDQLLNLAYYQRNGMAVVIDLKNISERTMTSALNKVLNDPNYRKAAKYQSDLFRDRPMSAIDTATYWIEYTIRNGPEVLKSPAVDLSWWQLDLLDVYVFLIISAITAIFLAVFVLKTILKIIIKTITNEDNSSLKNRTKYD